MAAIVAVIAAYLVMVPGGIVGMPSASENFCLQRLADSKFLMLSTGKTRVSLSASADPSAELVVLVHGLSSPASVWHLVKTRLLAQGFSVLTYDLPGRGCSESPDHDQTLGFFVSHLTEVLFALNLTQPFHLTGLSMGGPVVTEFAGLHPDRVLSLSLIAPAGCVDTPVITKLALIPIFGDVLFQTVGNDVLSRVYGGLVADAKETAEKEIIEATTRLNDEVQHNMEKNPGFMRSILSSVRHVPLDSYREGFQFTGEVLHSRGIPRQLIWGEADDVCAFEKSAEVKRLLGEGTQLMVLPNQGHECVLLSPEAVTEGLLSNIARNSKG